MPEDGRGEGPGGQAAGQSPGAHGGGGRPPTTSKWSSFIQRFYPQRFTVLTDIHPFMHTFTNRRWSQPRRATASSSGAIVRVRRLAQGHQDTRQLGGAGNRTSNLTVTSQPALKPSDTYTYLVLRLSSIPIFMF